MITYFYIRNACTLLLLWSSLSVAMGQQSIACAATAEAQQQLGLSLPIRLSEAATCAAAAEAQSQFGLPLSTALSELAGPAAVAQALAHSVASSPAPLSELTDCAPAAEAQQQTELVQDAVLSQPSKVAPAAAAPPAAAGYIRARILASTPGLRAWVLQHVPLFCSMKLGNNGLTPYAAVSPHQDRIAFVTREKPGRIYICDTRTHECLLKLGSSSSAITSMTFRPSTGTTLLTTSTDKKARLWNSKSGACEPALDHAPCVPCARAIFNYLGNGLLTIDGSKVLVYAIKRQHDGEERVELVHQLIAHNKAVTSATFNTQDTVIATASLDDSVHLWDVASGRCFAVFDLGLGKDSVPLIAFNRAGTQLAVATNQGTIMILDTEAREIIYKKQNAFPGNCEALRFGESCTDCFLETVNQDCCTRRWDLGTLGAIDEQLRTTGALEHIELIAALYEHCKASTESFDLARHTLGEYWTNMPHGIKNLLANHVTPQ